MKLIRDSVHGNLYLDEFEIKLLDTPQMQRLRRIKQLGFT
ncbi:MAG: HD domain-containing protein, partial [Methanobacterium sp.]